MYANSKYAHLALKTLNIDGIAIRNCQSNHNIDYCRQLEAMKFIREIAVIIDLQGDPTVPQVNYFYDKLKQNVFTIAKSYRLS